MCDITLTFYPETWFTIHPLAISIPKGTLGMKYQAYKAEGEKV